MQINGRRNAEKIIQLSELEVNVEHISIATQTLTQV